MFGNKRRASKVVVDVSTQPSRSTTSCRRRRSSHSNSFHMASLTILMLVSCGLMLPIVDAVGIFPTQSPIGMAKPATTNGSCASQEFCSHASPSWQSQACVRRQCNASCPFDGSVPTFTDLGSIVPGIPYTYVGTVFQFFQLLVLNQGSLELPANLAPTLDSRQPGFTAEINLHGILTDA